VLDVSKSRASAILAASVVAIALVASTVAAQPASGGRAAPLPGLQIALIDVGKIIKDDPTFKQAMAELDQQRQDAETRFKKAAERIRADQDSLRMLKAGSAEYDARDRKLTQDQIQFRADYELQKKDFIKEETKIVYAAHQRIYRIVEAYAQQNGTAVVLKFNSDQPTDLEKTDDLVRDLQKPVLFYHPSLDITPIILDALKQQAMQGAPGRSGGSFPPRPR
jgi:Skp family chaperone for outer membrane proteins